MTREVSAAVFLACAFLGCVPGCSDPPSRPPVDPRRDSGPRADGGSFDAPYVRPRDPVLPPADIEVTLPYLGPEATVVLEASAGLARLDVVFSIDTTGSFGGEIEALQASLESNILPALEARVDDVGIAVASFEDFPVATFGTPGDVPFRLESALSTDRGRARAGVASLSLGNGGDIPESGAEALFQIATGDGISLDGATLVPPYTGPGEGGVGFRPGSFRVIVHVTDAPTHEPADYGGAVPDAHGSSAAIPALQALGARVIGVASNDAARPHLETWARATGATTPPVGGTCHTGRSGATRPPSAGTCPLVFDIDGSGTGLSTAIVDAMTDLLDGVSWSEAHGASVGDPLHFVRAIEAERSMAPSGTAEPAREDRLEGDGIADTFVTVRAGTSLHFVAHLVNTTIEPADYEQIFRVTIQVLGDGLVLDERVVRVTVPAGRRDAGALDAPPAVDADLDAGTDAALDLDAGIDAP